MGIKIEVHQVEDWEGIYIDGKLVSEGHSDRLEEFLFSFFHKNCPRPHPPNDCGRPRSPSPLVIDFYDVIQHDGDIVDEYVHKNGRMPGTLEEFDELELDAKKAELEKLQEIADKAKAEYDKALNEWACKTHK